MTTLVFIDWSGMLNLFWVSVLVWVSTDSDGDDTSVKEEAKPDVKPVVMPVIKKVSATLRAMRGLSNMIKRAHVRAVSRRRTMAHWCSTTLRTRWWPSRPCWGRTASPAP